jgi:hypothetical protein
MSIQVPAKQLVNLAKWKPADGAARVAIVPSSTDAPSLAFQQAGAPLWTQLSTSNIDWHAIGLWPRDVNLAEAFWDDMQYSVAPTGVLPFSGMSLLTSGAGSSVAPTAAVTSDEIGLMRYSTGTTATGAAGLSKRFGTNEGQILSLQSFGVADDRIKLTALSTAAQEYNYFSGWDAGANDRAGLLYDRTRSVNWLVTTINGGVSTFTDSGVAVAAGLQIRLVTVKLPGELGIRCLIQGAGVVGLQTSNFPTARIARASLLSSTVGGTTKTADTDWAGGVFDFGGGRSP